MTKYELESLVDILNKKLYKSYMELLASNGFYVHRFEADGDYEYEDFLLPDESHCITHVARFNKQDTLLYDYWEVAF